MLKLKRIKNSQGVTVEMDTKEIFWNRGLINAFGIAVGIHLLSAVFFHIAPLSFTYPNTLLSPVSAVAEIIPGTQSILTDTGKSTLERFFSLAPEPSVPSIPTLTFASMQQEKIVFDSTPPIIDSFGKLDIIPSSLQIPSPPLTYKKIGIEVSGPLGNIAIINDGIDHTANKVTATAAAMQHLVSIYRVNYDGRTGKLFWIEQIQSTKNKLFDTKERELLQRMQFDRKDIDEIIPGEIRIVHAHNL
jgi:hypothetical protein